MLALLNGLAAAVGREVHVLGPRALRVGAVSVALTLGPEDLSGMSDRYDAFLQSRTRLLLRRGATPDEVPAIGIEALLATKLTRRGDKAKDLVDVTRILDAARVAGRPLDRRRVGELVGRDAEALALLGEIEARVPENP
jgi:hypothetical protein